MADPAGVTVVFLWIDLHFFARGGAEFREGVRWSIGWLVVSLLAAVVVWILSDADDAVTYTTVYFIERSLSLDNLFVFILLFSYFGVPEEHRARLLFWGIVAALVLRGLAILGGVALIEQFHFVIYVLGVLLLVLDGSSRASPRTSIRTRTSSSAGAASSRSPASTTGALVREHRPQALRHAAVPLPRAIVAPTSRSRSTRSRRRSRSRATPC